jgi:DNA invertase Pin-like site-specific DNA recombinase
MKDEKRAALYARVSSTDQNPAMQSRELREYCKLRGWKIYDEYVDRGISGAKDSRPQLDRLMSDAHRRRFGVVAVWRFDRAARSVSHLLRALETFRSLGIEFVSLSEQIDTTTPAGKMVFTVLGAVAELERSLIAERVRAGLRNAKARGLRLGRPPLRTLSTKEVRQLRRDRRQARTSFSLLANRYGVSVWTAFQLCKQKH